MKLDMANFAIDIFRPDIIANSVEYEKKKFAEYLTVQAGKVIYTQVAYFLLVLDVCNHPYIFTPCTLFPFLPIIYPI